MTFVFLVARAVKSGRKVCGQEKARDVLSPLAQQRQGFKVESLPTSIRTPRDHLYSSPLGQERQDAFEDRLRDNTVTPIPDQVQFRIDFPAWLKTLTPRERRIIKAMARNERTLDLSKQFEVSPGRISQQRCEFCVGWKRYCGDHVEEVVA
jgi:DNA-directed RNA polymerase sigma subunit (sigma70/sigma32)